MNILWPGVLRDIQKDKTSSRPYPSLFPLNFICIMNGKGIGVIGREKLTIAFGRSSIICGIRQASHTAIVHFKISFPFPHPKISFLEWRVRCEFWTEWRINLRKACVWVRNVILLQSARKLLSLRPCSLWVVSASWANFVFVENERLAPSRNVIQWKNSIKIATRSDSVHLETFRKYLTVRNSVIVFGSSAEFQEIKIFAHWGRTCAKLSCCFLTSPNLMQGFFADANGTQVFWRTIIAGRGKVSRKNCLQCKISFPFSWVEWRSGCRPPVTHGHCRLCFSARKTVIWCWRVWPTLD